MDRLAAVLIAAHVVGDFALQPGWLVRGKDRLVYLLLHAGIHAALVYLALQAWASWDAPLCVLVVHAVIDVLRLRCGDTARTFVVDQVLHVTSLVVLAWFLQALHILDGFRGIGYRPLIAFAGFVAAVRGSGFLVGKFASRLIEENGLEMGGLRDGGRMIGQLERALIFLFIFIGQPAGIGFLVAAKSILRFEEAKRQDVAEYVLIGTLLSFSLGIGLSAATVWALNLAG